MIRALQVIIFLSEVVLWLLLLFIFFSVILFGVHIQIGGEVEGLNIEFNTVGLRELLEL